MKKAQKSEIAPVVGTFILILGGVYLGTVWATGHWSLSQWSEIARLFWVAMCFIHIMMAITALTANIKDPIDPRLDIPRQTPSRPPRSKDISGRGRVQ